jgi:hypothetical protein
MIWVEVMVRVELRLWLRLRLEVGLGLCFIRAVIKGRTRASSRAKVMIRVMGIVRVRVSFKGFF